MKKIFTVLMALGIALCTMANPTFSVAERLDLSKVKTPKMEKQFTPVEKSAQAVRMDKQEARQAMVEARQAKAVAPMAVKGVRQIEAMPVATAQKQALPVVNNKQRAAAQVTEATDTVEIVATFWAWEYYESDNDWYTTLIDATETYEIKLDYVSDTQAGTFTEADCLMDYTGMYIYDGEGGRTRVGFTEVDIVVTDDENGLTLHAELLGTDNVLYVVDAYIAPLPEPKATVELAYANATLEDGTRSSGTFQFWGDENGVYTSILLASDQVEGEYNKFDMYVDYANYIMFVDGADTTFVDFLDLNAVVTKEDKTYNLVADALGSDTIMYHITMSYTKPAPTDTIDIVATNMVVDEFEFWGMVFCTITASNEEYTVTLDMANGLPMGELTSEDFNVEWSSVYRIADEEEIVFDEIISATVSEVEGKPAVKAQVVGVDNILYNLDLSYVIPEATDTVNVVFEEVAETQYYTEYGDYYIYNENENYIVTLDIFADKDNFVGEYTAEEFDMYYTQLGVIEAGDTTVVDIAAAQAVVTPVEEGIVLIEAELISHDAVLYKVSTKADVSNKGLQYDATEGFLVDEYTTEDLYTINDQSANGYIMFDVESADGNDLMGLLFWVDGADENTIIPTGTYPINGSGEAGTVLASTGMGSQGLTYSLYATLDEEGYIVEPCWFMVGGEVVVSEENGILSITVDAVNSNNLPIYITCEYDLNTKQGLQYDMTEGSVERTYSDADVVEINTDYVAQYGELYLDITAADGSDMISLAFFVEATDDEITIPAGVYPINDSGDYGTVYASPGVMDGSIYPSFYGVLSPTGSIVPPCYFMVGGQVVVENVNGQLKMTIDALNSYDVPAHIVYEVPVEEPVEQPEPVYTENNLNTYAFGLESELTEDASVLNVTYRLNNSNATSVNVLVYKGEEVVATVAGGTSIGKNVVEIATADLPQGRMLTWGVEVNGTSVEVPTQEAKIYSFYHPSGLDIDNNPENATFGMLLVNEGMESVASKTEGYVSAGFGAGIFAFAPSFDLIPNGELPGYKGGVEFTTTRADGTGTAYSPRRIRISEDGRIFVTSLNTDGNYLWEVNPENLDEWTSVFQGTLNENKELVDAEGNFVAAPNNGFDVKGAGENLQLAMYSVNLPGITGAAMSGFRLHEYNLGTATTWATAPSKAIVEGKYAINYTGTQVVYDNEGGVWIASYRGTANDANPGLVHINADGVEDLKLVWSNVRQAGIRFNNDFTKLVVAGNNGAAKKATIYSISKDENGAPVLTEETVIDMAVVGNNLNDFAWDYAGNLYACGNSAEKLVGWAMPYSGTVVTPAASEYAFQVGEPVEPVEMVGVVKRTLFNGYDVVVLTHEEDGTAHIYNIVEGDVLEVSQEGVIAVDPENAGDLLAISDIALTEDGKLVATNYMVTQSDDTRVDAGYKRGETRIYMWDDLAGAPSILFTSKMSSNWFRSKQGLTMAVKGTSDNMEIFMTGIHATSAWARVSSYRVIDGVYVEPDVNNNDYYHFYDINDAIALETTVGEQYELNASPLGAMNWVLDAEKINPTEITEPETNNTEIATSVALTEDLGKKYNGASYITIDGAVYMVAPFATPDGELVGIEILNISNGFDAPQYVDMLYLDEAVSAQAAATAVTIVENTLVVALVVDAQYYMFEYELKGPASEYEIYEEEITNLVIDLDNLVLMGGPGSAFQVEVYLPLGEYNMSEDSYQLTSESSIAVLGSDATFIEGWAYEVDAFTPSAKAVVRCEWNGMLLEFHLTMTAAPLEPTVVVVENAVVEIEKYLLWGDMYDYALKMTGEWINPEDGLTYPVLVDVPVYYPEATEPSEIFSTVTVGGMGDDDPWLGFGEGTLTVTTVDGLVTATGIVQNPMAGVAIDITISGIITPTGVENATVTVKPVKTIKNGQLIINKDGKEYNAQGVQL